jgi:hypothetical protein
MNPKYYVFEAMQKDTFLYLRFIFEQGQVLEGPRNSFIKAINGYTIAWRNPKKETLQTGPAKVQKRPCDFFYI